MPNSATPKLKEFAGRLLAFEIAADKPGSLGNPGNSAAFRVCEQLRLPLSKLLGTDGFRALLSRALALAAAEVHWLRALQIKADGSLEGLDQQELEAKLDTRAVATGEIVLVAQLLGLLVTFIGPALTLRLVHDIWPKSGNLEF